MDPVEWQTIAGVVSAAVALVAVGVAAVAAGYARGSRDQAGRQADAAEAQVEVMRRQLDLMEVQGAAAGTTRAVPYVSPWILQHFKGDTYSLTNGGTSPEYDVHVELPEHTPGRGPFDHERIDPRSSVTFMAVRTMASSNNEVAVTWAREQGGASLTWKTVLPPK